jgi:hypothetical protein
VIAAGPENELFLVAPNNRGALYFSRATSGDAAIESSWSTPARLAIGHDGEIGSADVAWDAAGTVYLVYSVPVNEGRGVYLVKSKDHGSTWSEPLQVFDGAAAGFDFVGAPSLLISKNGFLHIVWKRQFVRADGIPQPLSLYYTRSEDGGLTFNGAEPVVEQPVAWREIVTDAKGNLHLLWQSLDTMTTVWDQVSLDGGRSWQFPQALPNEGTIATVMVDAVGQLHVVNAGPGSVDHWLWNGSNWQPEIPDHWSLVSQPDAAVELFASAINKAGKMMAVFAVTNGQDDAESDVPERTLLYSVRAFNLPPKQSTTQKLPTQTGVAPTSIPATPTLTLSPTPAGAIGSESVTPPSQADGSAARGGISPVAMALLPVALLLLSVLGIAIRRATQSKDR